MEKGSWKYKKHLFASSDRYVVFWKFDISNDFCKCVKMGDSKYIYYT